MVQTGDTNIHSTTHIVKMAKNGVLTCQGKHRFPSQLDLELHEIFSPPHEVKVLRLISDLVSNPSQKYYISTHTLLARYKMKVTVVS
jgi:hypothetical protein